MNNILNQTAYFGIVLSLLTYWLAVQIRKKINHPLINPLLISALMSITVLIVFHIDYQTYNEGAKYITFLLTPSTVWLAVPLYKQSQILFKHFDAIIVSILSGCIAGMLCIVLICMLFHANDTLLFSMLPKSITTAIAIGVSELIQGNSTITVGLVIITGILGAVISKPVFKMFSIHHPVAIGLACGNSAHAIGTAKALEFGEIEGAMSSLSIVIAGVFTVILAPIIASLF